MAWALAMAVANAFVGDGAAEAGVWWLGVLFSHPLCDDVGSWQLPGWRRGPSWSQVYVCVMCCGGGNQTQRRVTAWCGAGTMSAKKVAHGMEAGQVGLRSERPNNLEQALLRWV